METYSEEEWNELRAVYLAMCKKVDAQFEKVWEKADAGISDAMTELVDSQ